MKELQWNNIVCLGDMALDGKKTTLWKWEGKAILHAHCEGQKSSAVVGSHPLACNAYAEGFSGTILVHRRFMAVFLPDWR